MAKKERDWLWYSGERDIFIHLNAIQYAYWEGKSNSISIEFQSGSSDRLLGKEARALASALRLLVGEAAQEEEDEVSEKDEGELVPPPGPPLRGHEEEGVPEEDDWDQHRIES